MGEKEASSSLMLVVAESETAVTVDVERDQVQREPEGAHQHHQRHACGGCHLSTESRSLLAKHMILAHGFVEEIDDEESCGSGGAKKSPEKKPKRARVRQRIEDPLGDGVSTTVETAIPGIRRLVRQPSYNCSLCTAAFLKDVDIEHHLKFFHTRAVEAEMKKMGSDLIGNGEDSVCRYCSKVFFDKNNLVRHCLEVHTQFRSHVCRLCPGRRGFHKPEFGHDHVRRFHQLEMDSSRLSADEFVVEAVDYVPRPYAMAVAVTPVPSHLYFVA